MHTQPNNALTHLTELGRFCLDTIVRFNNVLPPPGADEALEYAYYQQDNSWNKFIRNLSRSDQLRAIHWHATSFHELFHFHHFIATRTGVNLFHYLTHENEHLEALIWHPRPNEVNESGRFLRLDYWATLANTDMPPPESLKSSIILYNKNLDLGILEFKSHDTITYIPFFRDDFEHRDVYLGAQRLFENWAFLCEMEFVRFAYGGEAVRAYSQYTQYPPLYTTVERILIRACPRLAVLDPATRFSILNQIMAICLNTGTEDNSKDQGAMACGLKLFRTALIINEYSKDIQREPREYIIELEQQLKSTYGYLSREEVWRNMLFGNGHDWGCSSFKHPKSIFFQMQQDFTDFSKKTINAILDEQAFRSMKDYFKSLSKLPKPPLNFIMSDRDKGYELRFPKSENPIRWFPWIVWWFYMSVIQQIYTGQIVCPVKSDDFFCRLKIQNCGETILGTEMRPVDCLFYRVVQDREKFKIKFEKSKEAYIKALDGKGEYPETLMLTEYEPEIFLPLFRR